MPFTSKRQTRDTLPPCALENHVLSRERLTNRIRDFLDLPATIICASAGSGKTTLACDFARVSALPTVWHELESTDSQPSEFFRKLTHAFRRVAPHFGGSIEGLGDLQQLDVSGDQLADAFVDELRKYNGGKTALVIDGYHHLESSENISGALDRLIQYLPDQVHLILTCRAQPKMSVARLRSKGLVGVISTGDLSFTVDETRDLLKHLLKRSPGKNVVNEFHTKTRGWAKGLVDIAEVDGGIDRALSGQSGDVRSAQTSFRLSRRMAEYFESEVLRYESSQNQDALMRLSVLERIDTQGLLSVLPQYDGPALLEMLAKRNLFLTRIGPAAVDQYEFHPLFRAFLLQRFETAVGEERVSALRRQLTRKRVEPPSAGGSEPVFGVVERETVTAARYRRARIIAHSEHSGELSVNEPAPRSSVAASDITAHHVLPRKGTDVGVIEANTHFDLTINMLGPVEITRELDRVSPEAWTLSRALRILCFIAHSPNHRATKDSLIETFWSGAAPEDVDKNLWPTISHIRRALNVGRAGPKKNFIRCREGSYSLNPQFTYRIDTEEFERLARTALPQEEAGKREAFVSTAHRILDLYRGDFLEGFDDPWIQEGRSYYEGLYLTAVKELAGYHYSEADYDQTIMYCKMILSRDPYREDTHRQLMDAYMRIGNRAAAREQYERLKGLLREELGVDPLPETVAAYERLFTQG